MVGRQEFPVHHDVHSLAGGDYWLGFTAYCLTILQAQPVHPDPGGIDHAARMQLMTVACFPVFHPQADDLVALMDQPGSRAVIHQQCAMPGCRPGQCQRQPGIIKLAVPVLDATPQAVRLKRRQVRQSFGTVQKLGIAQSFFSSQSVINFQTYAIKRRLPKFVRGHDKWQWLRQMRCIGQQCRPLMQGFSHERNIALSQITNPAVHQLGGTRRRALGKVMRLDQHHGKAPRRCIERHAQACRTTADNSQVVKTRFCKAVHQRFTGSEKGFSRFKRHEFAFPNRFAVGIEWLRNAATELALAVVTNEPGRMYCCLLAKAR